MRWPRAGGEPCVGQEWLALTALPFQSLAESSLEKHGLCKRGGHPEVAAGTVGQLCSHNWPWSSEGHTSVAATQGF